jgi:hypothetical protein
MYVDGVFSPPPDFDDPFFGVPKRSSKSSPSPSSDDLLEPEDAGFAMAGSVRLPELERGDSAFLRVPDPDSRGSRVPGLVFAIASLGAGGAGVVVGGAAGVVAGAAGVPPTAGPVAGAGVAAAPGAG